MSVDKKVPSLFVIFRFPLQEQMGPAANTALQQLAMTADSHALLHVSGAESYQKVVGASYQALKAFIHEKDPQKQHYGLVKEVHKGYVSWVALQHVEAWKRGCEARMQREAAQEEQKGSVNLAKNVAIYDRMQQQTKEAARSRREAEQQREKARKEEEEKAKKEQQMKVQQQAKEAERARRDAAERSRRKAEHQKAVEQKRSEHLERINIEAQQKAQQYQESAERSRKESEERGRREKVHIVAEPSTYTYNSHDEHTRAHAPSRSRQKRQSSGRGVKQQSAAGGKPSSGADSRSQWMHSWRL
jgi:hypothetical protein